MHAVLKQVCGMGYHRMLVPVEGGGGVGERWSAGSTTPAEQRQKKRNRVYVRSPAVAVQAEGEGGESEDV